MDSGVSGQYFTHLPYNAIQTFFTAPLYHTFSKHVSNHTSQ